MKYFYAIIFLLIALALQSNAATDKYRVCLRDDPSTTMVISWNQISGTSPIVYYGTVDQGTNYAAYTNSKAPDVSIAHKGMNNRHARLTGLQPNTAYYFVIRDSEGTSIRMWFKTISNNPNERLSIIAGGDSRNNATPRRNANKMVAKLRPHVVMFGGDMTDAGSNAEWIEWFNDWQLTRSTDGRMYPIVATRGNHESSNNDIIYLFDSPGTGVYYALNFGGNLVRAYTLNTETTISGAQTTWLQNDLTANGGSVVWRIAQYHKPIRPHVSSKVEGTNQYTYWAPLFDQHKMNLVIESDAHTLKCTWPIRPSTGTGSVEGFIRDDVNGTVYIGEGCWGAPMRGADDNKSWTRNSAMLNHFNWIWVDQNKMESRTVLIDNADAVGTLTDANVFTNPTSISLWAPSNGSVVTITRPSTNVAPAVSITSPTSGQSYAAPQTITINANAADSDGSVAKVEYYANGSLVATDLVAPYSVNYAIPANGSYTLTAIAYDDKGTTKTSSAVLITCGAANVAPTTSITAPANNAQYTGMQAITISANAADSDGSVSKVDFYANNVLIGTDNTAPYSISWTPSAVGLYTLRSAATDNAGATTNSTNVSANFISSGGGTTTYNTSKRISVGSDDAEQATSGTMYLTSSDLELVYDSYQSAGNQQVGMRFTGLNIPKGATITSAYIQFTCDETTTGATSLQIFAENTDNAATFTTAANNISGRAKTSSSVAWSPASWTTVGQASTAQRTPELATLVQTVVNRTGYAATSAIAIIMTGTGARIAEAYEGSATQAPILYVTYTMPSARMGAAFDEPDFITLEEMNAYPNPFRQAFQLDMVAEGNVELQLMNAFGMQVWKTNVANWTGSYSISALEELPAGTYRLLALTSEGTKVRTVVKL